MPSFSDGEIGSSVRGKINAAIALAEGARQQSIDLWGWQSFDNTGGAQSLVLANTFYQLENDGAGPQTDTSKRVSGHGDIWDAATNALDFTSLSVGDEAYVRIGITVNTGALNRTFDLRASFGGVSPFPVSLGSYFFRDAGPHSIFANVPIYIGSTDVRDNPGIIEISSGDTGDTALLDGLYIRTSVR